MDIGHGKHVLYDYQNGKIDISNSDPYIGVILYLLYLNICFPLK